MGSEASRDQATGAESLARTGQAPWPEPYHPSGYGALGPSAGELRPDKATLRDTLAGGSSGDASAV
jgi:hypothetical protein